MAVPGNAAHLAGQVCQVRKVTSACRADKVGRDEPAMQDLPEDRLVHLSSSESALRTTYHQT